MTLAGRRSFFTDIYDLRQRKVILPIFMTLGKVIFSPAEDYDLGKSDLGPSPEKVIIFPAKVIFFPAKVIIFPAKVIFPMSRPGKIMT